MKAADRHLKLDEKRQTRIVTSAAAPLALEEEVEGSCCDSSSTSQQSGQQQLQFLMSSSSTPQLPSILENESQQNSVLSAPPPEEEPLKLPSRDQGREGNGGDDDNVSWGIPMTTHTATTRSSNNQPGEKGQGAEEGPAVSTSPSKKKKRKQKAARDEEQDLEGKEAGAGPHGVVDAPNSSSLSGVSSSLSMPSAGSGAPPSGPPSEIPQLPPISLRNRLSGFFTLPKKKN
jgi:hypothetical protein